MPNLPPTTPDCHAWARVEAPLFALSARVLGGEAEAAALPAGAATALLFATGLMRSWPRSPSRKRFCAGPSATPAFAPLACLALDAKRALFENRRAGLAATGGDLVVGKRALKGRGRALAWPWTRGGAPRPEVP